MWEWSDKLKLGKGSAFVKPTDLAINDWGRILSALCGTRVKEMPVRKHALTIARKIASHLAEALGIDAPPMFVK